MTTLKKIYDTRVNFFRKYKFASYAPQDKGSYSVTFL